MQRPRTVGFDDAALAPEGGDGPTGTAAVFRAEFMGGGMLVSANLGRLDLGCTEANVCK